MSPPKDHRLPENLTEPDTSNRQHTALNNVWLLPPAPPKATWLLGKQAFIQRVKVDQMTWKIYTEKYSYSRCLPLNTKGALRQQPRKHMCLRQQLSILWLSGRRQNGPCKALRWKRTHFRIGQAGPCWEQSGNIPQMGV